MANNPLAATRVPQDFLDRADELAKRLANDSSLQALIGGRPTRANVLRLAIMRGLEVLEAEHPATTRRKSK